MEFKQYPSYKPSGVEWLGGVPEHWVGSKFKYIFQEKQHTKNMNLPFGAISFGSVVYKEDKANLTDELKENYQEVLQGEFLVNPLNLNYDLKSLRTALSKIDVVVSSGYFVLKLKNNTFNKRYLEYLLYIFDIRKMKTLGAGIRQTLTFRDMAVCDVAIPSACEQTQIASFLDYETFRIDNLIAKQEKLIELLEEQRKSIISHAVTKGLNPNAPMKDSGVEWLGEVPESWVEQKIKFISKLINEKTSEKSNVIALENIESWTGKYIETESSFESDAVKFKKNDVLFGKLRPYLAKVYLVENQGEAVGDIYVLRPNKLIHPQFLKFFMLSEKFIDYVNSSTNGTKMPRANWDFIGCISIFLPHIKVQHEIVEYLESAVLKIELIINKQISLIEKLKEYRSSIISHAVTGKIDVREFGA